MSDTFVAILMGSASDLETVNKAVEVLQKLEVPLEQHILSAHRTPVEAAEYIEDAERRGCKVFIAAAGMAAHLAGAVAARTTKPVIGVPLDASPVNGIDSLLSTVQMPAGIPVATVAIGSAGARNAAYLAAQIIALTDAELAQRLVAERQQQKNKVLEGDRELQQRMNG